MNKPFDAVQWMRSRRAQIDKEDEGLSWAERSRKTVQLVRNDPLWLHIRSRVPSHADAPHLLVREDAEEYGPNGTSE
jgi:hypothetical protein